MRMALKAAQTEKDTMNPIHDPTLFSGNHPKTAANTVMVTRITAKNRIFLKSKGMFFIKRSVRKMLSSTVTITTSMNNWISVDVERPVEPSENSVDTLFASFPMMRFIATKIAVTTP